MENLETKKARGVPKNSKRPWVAGKPKFKNGELQKVTILLSGKHVSFLKEQQEGASAFIRVLLDRYMVVHSKAGSRGREETPKSPTAHALTEVHPSRKG